MTVIRKARMPPRLGRMKSIDILMATATHSKTDSKEGRTPTRHKHSNQCVAAYWLKKGENMLFKEIINTFK